MIGRVAIGLWMLLLLGGCGKRIAESTTAPPDRPRIGWIMMAGDRENPDDHFVCQSNPRTDCVLPVSRPDRESHTTVHFYFHSAATDTKYTGTIELAFAQGAVP